jgi:hypothetical protein
MLRQLSAPQSEYRRRSCREQPDRRSRPCASCLSYQAVAQSNRAALSRSSTTPSAATSLSMSRLYIAQRIRGGLSGYSSSAGSPPSLRRSLRARRRAVVGRRRQAHKRAATKNSHGSPTRDSNFTFDLVSVEIEPRPWSSTISSAAKSAIVSARCYVAWRRELKLRTTRLGDERRMGAFAAAVAVVVAVLLR